MYKLFTDQERIEETRSRQALGSLADDESDPWSERTAQLRHVPQFRPRAVKRNWRSATAPGGFSLTEPNPGKPVVKPSALDAPWEEPQTGAPLAHADCKDKWYRGERFYSRSHLRVYQRSALDRVALGERTSIWRKPGHALSAGESASSGRGRDLSNSLVVRDGLLEWTDGSESAREGANQARARAGALELRARHPQDHSRAGVEPRGARRTTRAADR